MNYSVMIDESFTYKSGGPTAVDVTVYDENGKYKEHSRCTGTGCRGDFSASYVLSVKATAINYMGFVLYETTHLRQYFGFKYLLFAFLGQLQEGFTLTDIGCVA